MWTGLNIKGKAVDWEDPGVQIIAYFIKKTTREHFTENRTLYSKYAVADILWNAITECVITERGKQIGVYDRDTNALWASDFYSNSQR